MFESLSMRWENLKLGSAPDQRDALPLALPGAVARTFDTPEFRGITCYEIRAKSILNRVPGESRLPFQWTLNPYRGCTHACTYCLAGDTRILMADGRTKELAHLRAGDEIYGTERHGPGRRFVRTTVLAHWPTRKPAHRVALDDGTRLVASGDHRFLTGRGWRHVTDLGPGDTLVGTGRFADGPKHDDGYRRGYLCGLVRGDARHGIQAAQVDVEALERGKEYLADFGVPTTWFRYRDHVDGDRPMAAIRAAEIETVARLVAWPEHPADSWTRGFLAGMFDTSGTCPPAASAAARPRGAADAGAGGGRGSAALVIGPVGGAALAAVVAGLDRLGFHHEVTAAGAVRVLGDLGDRLRFVHGVDPAVTHKRTVDGEAITSDLPLRVTSVDSLGITVPLFDITTGTGDFIAEGVVSHNCFARKTHTYLDLDSGHDFDSRIVVKVNAPELLRKELSAASWHGHAVALGTNVDPYQRAEGRYRLMRGILRTFGEFANPYSILTKGTLVLRDLDLLSAAAERMDVHVSVSIGFVDPTLWRQVEPGAPSPQARLRVRRTLTDAGVQGGVLMAPILPFLTDGDEQLEATVAAIAGTGADSVTPIVLHLRPGAREWFLGWLGGARPDLVPAYERLYGRGAYAPRDYTRAITARVAELARAYGIGRDRPAPHRQPPPSPPKPEEVQLSLL